MDEQEILVVDDEPPVRALMLRWAEKWGYRARAAGSAIEALDLMADAPARVLVCDIRMPDRDGLWLAEQVRQRWPETAVVMATGVYESNVVRTSRKLGAVGYVTKPFDLFKLHEAIDHAAGRLQFRPSVEQIIA